MDRCQMCGAFTQHKEWCPKHPAHVREVDMQRERYIAGLRRAQELAKEHLVWSRASGDVILAEAFDQAIDAEAAKGGTYKVVQLRSIRPDGTFPKGPTDEEVSAMLEEMRRDA
jgi:hypothetical protein